MIISICFESNVAAVVFAMANIVIFSSIFCNRIIPQRRIRILISANC